MEAQGQRPDACGDSEDEDEAELLREQEQELARRLLTAKLRAYAEHSAAAEAARRAEQQAMISQLRKRGILKSTDGKYTDKSCRSMLGQQSQAGDLVRDIRLELLDSDNLQAAEAVGEVGIAP